ncbi:MAG: hypothetical protein AAF226_10300 [Verrucomicrobiota bacterium]
MRPVELSSTLLIMSDNQLESIWRRRAAQVARHINFGWWMQRFAPFLILGAALFAITVLLIRTLRPEWVDPLWFGIAGGVLLLVGGISAWGWARKRFITSKAGLVRLDDSLNLNNSLVTADRGLGRWPQADLTEGNGSNENLSKLRWNWPIVITPFAIASLLALCAFLLPVPKAVAKAANLPTQEPGAWQQMEDWLDKLRDEELVEDSAIDEAQDKIDELRDQPEDEWFSHSSMEATDTLKDTMGRDLQEMAKDLATLERDIAALEQFGGKMSEAAKKMLMEEYDKAMKNLGLNSMGMNQELMKQLQNVDPSKLGQGQMSNMTPEQMQALMEKLQNAKEALESMEELPEMKPGGT